MDQELQPSSELADLYRSLPKGVDFSPNSEPSCFVSDELRILNTDILDVTDAGNTLIGSILRDDKAQLVSQTKRFLKTSPNRNNSEENKNRDDDAELLDRTVVSKLLRLCCMFDSVECASALIGGEVAAIVPRVNDIDESGRSALHTASEVHATRCIELLLRKRARTDLTSRDGQSQVSLELSLCSRRMDVIWTVNDPIEDLLICLNQKDLTAVRLLSEKTKEIAEVAYAIAMDCKAVALAALLMVAAKKFTTSIVAVVRTHGDLSVKEKATIYDCVIREALSLSSTESSAAGEQAGGSTNSSESSEKRKLLLCEMELLQLYGAVAQSGCTDKKVTSPLIRASRAGDAAVVKILLKTKMDMNEADGEGNSALHWSLKVSPSSVSNQIKIVCLLLKHGARVGQRNRLGLTALHIAAANGNMQALQILLLEDPEGVHATTETKETPLFFAVKNDYMDCVELLLQCGANSELLNLRKQRPIDLAKSQDMRFILKPANISLVNRPCSAQRKYTAVFNNDGVISETCESLLDMIDDDSTTERICSGMKTEICRYFESPNGCVRGAKCFYAHGEQEIRSTKHGTKWFHFRMAELRRKIFVGGLPTSLESESLGKYFEQFGSVEEANVVGVHGNQQQSRGFGFVTFKHENSVAVAIQAHYVSIMGKQVEIKSAVPKSLILSELQNLSPQPQKEQEQNSQLEPPTPSADSKNTDDCRPEPMSWADRLRRGQPKICSNERRANVIPTSVNPKEPAWLRTLKKWIPKFLKEVCERLREGEWYALSSLKGDFRAICGVELDHASLGYSKLSDFIKSLPGICRMKIVPVGGRGPATHMVLLPNLTKPKKELVQPIKLPDTVPCTKSIDANGGDSTNSKFLEDVLLVSDDNVALLDRNLDRGYPFHEVPQKNSDTLVTSHPRFLQFLKPDQLFHARPWINARDGCTDVTWEIEGERKLCNQERHLVLEALARKQNNSSVFFLRDLDFFKNYKASIAQGKCFACSQRKIVWANFPCQHLLWCSECKVHAARAAGMLEHKCVICDARVLDLVISCSENHQRVCNEVSRNKEFPPYDPNTIRSLSEKMRYPLLSH